MVHGKMELWYSCGILLVYIERKPTKWLRKKKIKQGILKLSTCRVICIESVKILCLEIVRDRKFLLADPDSAP
jgi:hypothetical protein